MAILYAYFDESGKKGDHPVVTFTGVCVSQFKLANFDDAWNTLLRQYGLPYLHMAKASRLKENNGPKMPRNQTFDERTNALMPFADCINENLEMGLVQALDVKGFNSLSEAAKVGLGSPDDPYYIAFSNGLMEVVNYVHGDDRISLICDDDAETAWNCYTHYRGVKRAHEEIREKIVSLSFADDESFPALQAADMVAFLSRLEAKRRFYREGYGYRRLFNHLTDEDSGKPMRWRSAFADEARMKRLGASLEKLNIKKPKNWPKK